ncbi:YolD-like family protein [Paraliobacillus sp. JSM ZJ581]|uniref:YolD-like family protein n=1 Tax=Paraliobacillus sp. JSM ZJ581 TaxID=3342118 RepID=UPI0035A915CC
MKPNKLTQGYNMMWESSRMILPEHKAILKRHQNKQKKYEKPKFDEQELAQLSEDISFAFYKQHEVKIVTYHPQQFIYYTGKIEKVNTQQDTIKIVNNEKEDWISFYDVLSVTIS